MTRPRWQCRHCGSTLVQRAVWVAVNDGDQVLDELPGKTYCEACDERGRDALDLGLEPWEPPAEPEWEKPER